MRPTLLQYAIVISAICVVVIVTVAHWNVAPPTPYVRLDSDRIAPIYLSRIECVNGFELQTYAQDGGAEIPPVLTDRPCATHPSR